LNPSKVETFPYKKQNSRFSGLEFAVVYCEEELYHRMASSKGINVMWQWCRIDSEPRAIKCSNCGLLGHIAKYCKDEETVKQIRSDDAVEEECIDCIFQNVINKMRKGYNKKPTNHKGNTTECPTYRNMTRQKIRQWKL